MPETQLNGTQIKDGSIQRADLDVSTSGSAVVAKVVAGTGISFSSTGPDAGTGDVTINASGSSDPLGALTATVNQPIPTSIVDVATNGTNYVGVTATLKIYVTSDPTVTSGWAGYESGTPALISICRMSGVGYVGITAGASGTNQVWLNANEDGLSWVNQQVQLPFVPACIRSDGTHLVICGSNVIYPVTASTAGQIWTSTDAVTWTQQTSNAGANNLTWLSYNATSTIWWCVGAAGKLLSSPDGTTWTSRTSNTAVALVRVEQTPNGTSGACAISADGSLIYTTAPGTVGTAWTKVTAAAGGTGSAHAWSGLAMSNTVYLVTSSNGGQTGIYSTNFTTWAKFGGVQYKGVCYGNGNYFVVGQAGVLAGSSLNALTLYSDAQLDPVWGCCVYHAGNSIYIAGDGSGLMTSFTTSFVGTSRTSGFSGSAINDGIYDPVSATVCFVGAGGKVFWSLNGTTVYTAATGVQGTQLNSICTDASNAVNKFCAVGNSGVITTLTAAFVASTTQTSGTTANLLGCASNGAGTFCAVGVNVIGTSTNSGVTWTWQDLMTNGIGTPLLTFQSIRWDGTRFVAKTTTGLIFWSTAGTGSWTLKSCDGLSLAAGTANLFYVNSIYVGTGVQGQITSSTDCISWTLQRSALQWGGSGIAQYLNSNFFIFGTAGYYQSSAGVSWSSYLGGNVGAATSLSGHMSAVNANGTVINSTDGATFSLVANQLGAAVIGMANDATNMIAVTVSAVYRSTDNGATWTQTASRTVTATFAGSPACAYGNGYFIVTGTLGYWIYSSDGGATWTAGMRVSHTFQSICYDATLVKFVGVCTNGVIVTGTGTTLTANNGLVAAGSPISTTAKIATDGLGNVVVADFAATSIPMFLTTDGSTFKLGRGPTYGFGTAFVNINGLYCITAAVSGTTAYTSDRVTWFSVGSSANVAWQWGIYFNSKYIFFASGNIATLS